LLNIGLFLTLQRHARRQARGRRDFQIELMLLLCAAYVFGCAFRSVLPRADVQRIVMFDTWLSSVAVGRSVATVAEICFVIQWAIVLRFAARLTQSDFVRGVSTTIVPLIVLAECCSWYAVITANFLGNTVENSLWAVAFALIAAALMRLMVEFRGAMRAGVGAALAGVCAYLAFLVAIDVPMYFGRWQADLSIGKRPLGFFAGLQDIATRWTVTHDIAHWSDEIAWMSLYFSAAVWSSLVLCGVFVVRDRLQVHRASPARRDARPEVREQAVGWVSAEGA
jgi:hypothetical protein